MSFFPGAAGVRGPAANWRDALGLTGAARRVARAAKSLTRAARRLTSAAQRVARAAKSLTRAAQRLTSAAQRVAPA